MIWLQIFIIHTFKTMLTDTMEYDLRKWLSKWFQQTPLWAFIILNKQQHEVTRCTMGDRLLKKAQRYCENILRSWQADCTWNDHKRPNFKNFSKLQFRECIKSNMLSQFRVLLKKKFQDRKNLSMVSWYLEALSCFVEAGVLKKSTKFKQKPKPHTNQNKKPKPQI